MDGRDTESTELGNFAALGLDDRLEAACLRARLDAPTDLQHQMIPAILAGRDCLAIARSGAGKTNAYILPIVQRLSPQHALQAVVIQPTRATARIILRGFHRFAERSTQVELLADTRSRLRRRDPHVLVSTPHAAVRLLERQSGDWWSSLKTVVVDDLDTLIQVGAREPTESFLRGLDPKPQLVLITGDMNEQVEALAGEFLDEPARFEAERISPATDRLRPSYVEVGADERFDALCGLLRRRRPRLALVFTGSADSAQSLARRLNAARFSARWIEERRRRHHDRRTRATTEVAVAGDPPAAVLRTIPAAFVVHYDLPDEDGVYAERMDQCERVRRGSPCVALITAGQRDRLDRLGKQLELQIPPYEDSRPEARQAEPDGRAAEPAEEGESDSQWQTPEQSGEEPKPMPKTLGSRFPVRREKRLIPRWKDPGSPSRW
jgi:ATP-dependent RNA helicase DeaD